MPIGRYIEIIKPEYTRSGVLTMQRVGITIDGKQYTIIADDEEIHALRSAQLVDDSLQEIKKSSRGLATVDAAILTALNMADKYLKAQQSTDNMRAQIKSYAEECASLRSEIIKLKKHKGE